MVEHTFEGVLQAAEAYRTLLLALDPGVLGGPACERLVELVTHTQRVEAVVMGRLVRRASEANVWRAGGARSADEWLARTTGTSLGRARAELALADDLAQAPATEEAMAKGKVSADQATEIASAARADPGAEQALLKAAATEPLSQLRRRARMVRAAATDEASRREKIHRGRHFRHWTDADGAFCFAGRGLPEHGAALLAALRPLQDATFDDARKAGARASSDAYAYDALMALVTSRSEGESKAPVKIILTVDLSAMARGHTSPGETCEIAGIGPVAVSVARDLLGDAFLALVVTDGIDIRNVTHLGRAPTAHQRTALEARGQLCAVPGCGRTTPLEIDHVDGWAITRRTHVDQLEWLCGGVGGHHHKKSHDGYTLGGSPGARSWHPPRRREAPAAVP